jgi:o-succinylbenzoate---CoA ligase
VKDWPLEQAKRDPRRPFLVTRTTAVTYGQAEDMIARAAGAIATMIQPGDLVGVPATSTVETVVTMLAVPRAGGVLLPVGANLTGPEVERLCGRFGAVLLEEPAADAAPLAPRDIDPRLPYAVFATSGSTGEPKGVVLTAGNLTAAADASAEFLGHRDGGRWLAVLPLNHVGGFSILTRSAQVGGAVFLEQRFDPARTAALLHDVEYASLVPTMLAKTLPHVEGPFERLVMVLVGGGPLAPGLLADAVDSGIPAAPTYGATETAAQIATGRAGGATVRPLPGVSLWIESGEIVVDGPMVSPGYWGMPPREGPYHTGDAGSLDSGGDLTVLGRLDDMVISGGENVYPTEVEQVLLRHPGVHDAAVIGVPDARWGRVLHAVVVAPDVDAATLDAWARKHLAGYKVPKRWRLVEHIARTELGKLDRREVES